MSELRLVEGMNDQIYDVIKNYVTVYNGAETTNVCLGDDSLLRSFILHFTQNAGCASPIKEDDEERFEELITEVLAKCPDPGEMAVAFNSKLGLVDLSDSDDSSSSSSSKSKSKKKKGPKGSTVDGCTFQFMDLLGEDNNIFTVRATGAIGADDEEDIPTQVSITTVIENLI